MPKVVDHAARRSEISAVAAKLIAKGGLETATIREIAANSGYSKGIIEHYFEDKQELISGALAWANQSYMARADKATKACKGLAAIRARLEVTLPLTEAIRNEWKVRLVFWSMAAIQPALRRQQAARLNNIIAYFEQDIDAAIEFGEIETATAPAELAKQIQFFVSGISCTALHNPSVYTKDVLLTEIEQLLQRICRSH